MDAFQQIHESPLQKHRHAPQLKTVTNALLFIVMGLSKEAGPLGNLPPHKMFRHPFLWLFPSSLDLTCYALVWFFLFVLCTRNFGVRGIWAGGSIMIYLNVLFTGIRCFSMSLENICNDDAGDFDDIHKNQHEPFAFYDFFTSKIMLPTLLSESTNTKHAMQPSQGKIK